MADPVAELARDHEPGFREKSLLAWEEAQENIKQRARARTRDALKWEVALEDIDVVGRAAVFSIDGLDFTYSGGTLYLHADEYDTPQKVHDLADVGRILFDG